MILFLRFLLKILFSLEKIYRTLETVFEHISKNHETRQKYSAARRIFKSFFGVWKCDETRV